MTEVERMDNLIKMLSREENRILKERDSHFGSNTAIWDFYDHRAQGIGIAVAMITGVKAAVLETR